MRIEYAFKMDARSGLVRLARLALLTTVAFTAAESVAQTRSYDEGPLDFKLFLGNPPPGVRYDAETITHLKYDYRYRTFTRNGVATVTLSKMTVGNEVLLKKSWTRKPNDAVLLRHEQGHFDITEIIRRRADAYWKAKIGKFKTQASTLSAAVKEFDELVRREMDAFLLRLELQQKQYDIQTNHGLNPAQQARWREQLTALLSDPMGAWPAATPPAPAPGLNR